MSNWNTFNHDFTITYVNGKLYIYDDTFGERAHELVQASYAEVFLDNPDSKYKLSTFVKGFRSQKNRMKATSTAAVAVKTVVAVGLAVGSTAIAIVIRFAVGKSPAKPTVAAAIVASLGALTPMP
jgi:hypothetical protein